MKKKLIAFDLDGTLAPSKSPLPDRIEKLLTALLEKYQVCVISGGKYQLFQTQLLANLHAAPELLNNLHLMPTSGTRYYRHKNNSWKQVYAEDLRPTQKQKIIKALNEGLDELKWRPDKTWGEIVEDRDSQITLSILGQEAPLQEKETWDPDGSRKMRLREVVAPKIPEFEVRAAGTTSIDVTKPGIDKAYGMQKLLDLLSISKQEALYMGDKVLPGGNDYPVKAMGIDTIEVTGWENTAIAIEAILEAS
ncbi:HAD-IIB family hydrolase [Candidatus Saccharibacteria bacterium]|nr:HAD-IIB family hydrolase [Candidatus Saccharibacteria bacterium]